MLLYIVYMMICINLSIAHRNDCPVCNELENIVGRLCSGSDQMSSVSTVQGPPGKKGPIGDKGKVGSPGSSGPPGVVNYNIIHAKIDTKMKSVIDHHDNDTRDLILKIEKLEEKINILENREGACEVKYNNKCFWVVAIDQWVTGYDVLSRFCSEKNGSPANIYSKEHYDVMMRYLRSKIIKINVIAPWTGMRYNPKTGIVSLTDGTPATFMKWYPGYPSNNPTYTHMTIVKRSPSTDTNVGMHNWSPTKSRDGVLCEL